MKKIKKVGSIVCLLIVAIVIQAVSGGGIGLSINPKEIDKVVQGSTITYDITVYNYQDTPDSFDVFVLLESCDSGWFHWTTNQISSVPANGGQKKVWLDVEPTKRGNYKFTVRAVSKSNPGISATDTAHIKMVDIDKKPDLIITKIWVVGNTIHYEVMNVGEGIAPAEWEADLYVNDIWQAWQVPMARVYPGERLKQSFPFYELKCVDTKRIKVCIENVEGEKRKDNNCLEEVLKCNQPPTCIALMPDVLQPQVCGKEIIWTACAFDPEGDELQYRFLLDGPGTESFMPIVQNWSKSNKWIWRTDERDIGYNLICVDVKDGYHENNITMIYPPQDYDLSTCQWYLINSPTAVINEVELNPPEDDRLKTTMEWIELYNPIANDINLSGWTLSSTQYSGGKTFELSGTIKPKGYYVFEHSRWLHNTKGESVILRNADGTEIDRTPLLKDDYNDDHTWQRYPNGRDTDFYLDWDFRPSTKEYSNGG